MREHDVHVRLVYCDVVIDIRVENGDDQPGCESLSKTRTIMRMAVNTEKRLDESVDTHFTKSANAWTVFLLVHPPHGTAHFGIEW